MNYTLYLVGYGNEIPSALFARLEDYSAHWLILDVRSRRMSWCIGYRYNNLEMALRKRGHEYIWLHELGAANGGLVNEGAGMLALEAQIQRAAGQKAVALLCAERSSQHCHRLVVARKLQQRLARAGHTLEIRTI